MHACAASVWNPKRLKRGRQRAALLRSAGDAALLPKAQANNSWDTAWQKLQPKVEEREKQLVKELEELRAKERWGCSPLHTSAWRCSA